MTPKTSRFSLFVRIQHEFRRAQAELQREGVSRGDILARIQQLQSEKTKELARNSTLFLLAAIVATQLSVGEQIEIKTAFVHVSFPKIYVIVVAAGLFWAMTMTSLITLQYVVLDAFISNNVTEGTRYSALKRHLVGKDGYDLSSPIRNSGLHRGSGMDAPIVLLTYMAPILLLALPNGLALWAVIQDTFGVLANAERWSLNWGLTTTVIGVLYFSIAYFVMYFIPMKIEKNLEGIRWGFFVTSL